MVAQSAGTDPLEQKDSDSPGTTPTISKKKGKKEKKAYPPKIESPAQEVAALEEDPALLETRVDIPVRKPKKRKEPVEFNPDVI